ncbi:hypothetical protein PENTCL1PPCAC_16551, partial [Pristionchus entomophagus]
FITVITLALGAIGIIANFVLFLAIIFRTPSHMRVYSRILGASAVCDLVGLGAMMLTVTKEKIFRSACILEYHGVCSLIGGIDFCGYMFGVQEHMYTATCLLLNFSFVYRLFTLQRTNNNNTREITVILIIVLIIVVHFPLIPLYHLATTRKDGMVDQYRHSRGIGNEQALGVIQYGDFFTVVVCSYSMLSSFLPFSLSVVMRKKIIRKMEEMRESLSVASKSQHDMLVRALNLQLTVSSFFMIGCALFLFNLVILNVLPGFPETSDIVVPLCNLQNVISAFTNIIIITPYRKRVVHIFFANKLPFRSIIGILIPSKRQLKIHVSLATNSFAPSHMRVYSRILAAHSACDLVGLAAMILSVTKQKIFSTAYILEFHGLCSAIGGVDFCGCMFGVQEHMYTATCLLLCMSFAYRLNALERSTSNRKRESR